MIPKTNAITEAETRHAAAAKALEERIDNNIRSSDGRYVYVDTVGVPSLVVNMVKKKYEEGGWTVTLHDDQRDGPSMALS